MRKNRRNLYLIYQCFRQAYVTINVLKFYHPFINGPNEEHVEQRLLDDLHVRINIPPLGVIKGKVKVALQKNGVMEVVEKNQRNQQRCGMLIYLHHIRVRFNIF